MAKGPVFTPAAMSARMDVLKVRQAELRKDVDRLQAERDAWWAEVGKKEREYHNAIVAARAGDDGKGGRGELFEVEAEIALIARALQGA